MWQVAREHRRLLLTLGAATTLVGAVRGARQTVIPLWGEALSLDPEVISVVFGISGALDMLLFYPAGRVMDHYGRLWIGVPSMLVMGASLAVLPLVSSVPAVATVAALARWVPRYSEHATRGTRQRALSPGGLRTLSPG